MLNKFLSESLDEQMLRFKFASQFPDYLKIKTKGIIVVGASAEGIRLISLCDLNNIKVHLVCDGDLNKQKRVVADKYIIMPVINALDFGDDIPIIIASHKGFKAINELKMLGVKCVIPFAVLQILFADKFKPHMFYRNWIESLLLLRDKYNSLKSLFADETSKATLEAIFNYRFTFDDTYLFGLYASDPYMLGDIVEFNNDGVYIDGGAFDGDSINHYIHRAQGKYSKILAFEPDPNTFIKLKKNMRKFPNVLAYQTALFSCTTTLRFNSDESRASLISNEGNVEINTVTIDEVLSGNPVTYIKLNVEGAEIHAINGAKESIKRYRPILAIAAYHSPEHIWEVAELIKKTNPNYKLYLRQHDFGSVETVVYAI